MSYSSRDRARGFSILEVLICLLILGLSLVPVVDLFLTSSRIGHSARRLVDATLYGQTILEGLAMLEPADLPDIPPGTELILLDGDHAQITGGENLQQVAAYFSRSRPFEFEGSVVSARRFASGGLQLRVELKWLAVASDPRTSQSLTLQVLTPPRRWR